MGKGMCEFKFSPSKIEYSTKDKVNFYFFRLFKTFLCAQFFSNFTLHILTNFSLFSFRLLLCII